MLKHAFEAFLHFIILKKSIITDLSFSVKLLNDVYQQQIFAKVKQNISTKSALCKHMKTKIVIICKLYYLIIKCLM